MDKRTITVEIEVDSNSRCSAGCVYLEYCIGGVFCFIHGQLSTLKVPCPIRPQSCIDAEIRIVRPVPDDADWDRVAEMQVKLDESEACRLARGEKLGLPDSGHWTTEPPTVEGWYQILSEGSDLITDEPVVIRSFIEVWLCEHTQQLEFRLGCNTYGEHIWDHANITHWWSVPEKLAPLPGGEK